VAINVAIGHLDRESYSVFGEARVPLLYYASPP